MPAGASIGRTRPTAGLVPGRAGAGHQLFIDCQGRQLDVAELAPPKGVFPVVSNDRTLSIDLRSAVSEE